LLAEWEDIFGPTEFSELVMKARRPIARREDCAQPLWTLDFGLLPGHNWSRDLLPLDQVRSGALSQVGVVSEVWWKNEKGVIIRPVS
jgi:hypothetical protein